MSERHVSIGMTPTEDTTRIPMYLDVSRIVEAVSPHVTLTQTDDGVVITVEDIDGTKAATVYNGPEGPEGPKGDTGERGEPGQDGFSPTVTITEITGGHRITITDATGAHSADVMDGEGGVTDVTVGGYSIVRAGVAQVKVSNGLQVSNNNDRAILINEANQAMIKSRSNLSVITPSNQNASVFYGLATAAGDTTQSQSSNAVGNYTESAKSAISQMLNAPVTVTGSTPTITALPGVRYVCGEVTTLDITLPASGCIDVVFESGSTATTLTITPPTGVTLKWANGFDPTALDANTTYEINICDGLGVACAWT